MPTITVDPNNSDNSTACSPSSLKVAKNAGANVPIQFVIAGTAQSNWSWSQNPKPIVFKNSTAPFTGGDFPGGNGNGPVSVTDLNGADQRGTFSYTATLVKSDGTVRSIDPDIENEA